MDNAIVMDDYRVLNTDGLRYDDEFVKHKILDAIGDLYLVGKPLLAAYSAFRSGHALNNKLLRELLAQQDACEIVTFEDEKQAPAGFAQAGAGLVGDADLPLGIVLLLITAGVLFAFYAGTGQARFKRWGLVTLEVDLDRGLRLHLWRADPGADRLTCKMTYQALEAAAAVKRSPRNPATAAGLPPWTGAPAPSPEELVNDRLPTRQARPGHRGHPQAGDRGPDGERSAGRTTWRKRRPSASRNNGGLRRGRGGSNLFHRLGAGAPAPARRLNSTWTTPRR